MKQSTDPVKNDDTPGAPTAEEVMGKVRTLVGALLEAEAQAPHISYALAYVATELGLFSAAEAVQVFPVVLSAISRAAADHNQEGDESQSTEAASNCSDEQRPEGATLH